jgi:hypothetical protein
MGSRRLRRVTEGSIPHSSPQNPSRHRRHEKSYPTPLLRPYIHSVPPGRRRVMTGARSAGCVIQGVLRERNRQGVGDETCCLGSGTKMPVVKNPLASRTRGKGRPMPWKVNRDGDPRETGEPGRRSSLSVPSNDRTRGGGNVSSSYGLSTSRRNRLRAACTFAGMGYSEPPDLRVVEILVRVAGPVSPPACFDGRPALQGCSAWSSSHRKCGDGDRASFGGLRDGAGALRDGEGGVWRRFGRMVRPLRPLQDAVILSRRLRL